MKEDWVFVPDEHGGHMLSSTGDKWYPESFLKSQVAAVEKQRDEWHKQYDEKLDKVRELEKEVAHWKVEWKIDRDSWSEASRKATKFEEQVEYATELLKAVEWRGFHRNFPEPVCPYCGGEKEQQGHKEGCKLGEFLR